MTIVQNASQSVPDFAAFFQKFLQRMTIHDRARSTISNYGRSLAALALHYNQLPTTLAFGEIEDYLFLLKQKNPESDNAFKMLVCALRFVFRQEGLDGSRLKLPPIRRSRRLPIVLSREEVKAIMTIPNSLRHRVIIALLYGCGLRCGEIRNLRITDIDLDRSVLHIREGKGKKDRYVPLGIILSVLLTRYLEIENPQYWLIPGKRWPANTSRSFVMTEPQYGQRSIQWTVKQAAAKAGIQKAINVHSFRHTYATHLLEDGVSIQAVKELLGHATINTTLIYLQVAQVINRDKCSPLDRLEGLRVLRATQASFAF